MLAHAAAFLFALQAGANSLPNASTERIFSTIDHSEWCPAGNVQLDLQSGVSTVTPGATRPACTDPRLERPAKTGKIDPVRRAEFRTAFHRAMDEGLVNPECRGRGRPTEIVVSNGGTPVLVLTTGAATISAPHDLACWSRAADDLHRLLEDEFSN